MKTIKIAQIVWPSIIFTAFVLALVFFDLSRLAG